MPPAGPGGEAVDTSPNTQSTSTCADDPDDPTACTGRCFDKTKSYTHIYCEDPTTPGGSTSLGGEFSDADAGEFGENNSGGGGTSVSPGNPAVGNNAPSFGESNFSEDPLGVLNTGSVNSNLPPQATAAANSIASNVTFYPTEDEVFDQEHNLLVTTNQSLLAFARNQAANPIFSEAGLFKNQINVAVGDILRGNMPYSGIAVSNLLYNQQAIPEAITESVQQKLDEAAQFNVTTRRGKDLLTNAIRRATILGTVDGYNQEVLDEIIEAGKTFFPNGIPKMPDGSTDLGSRLKYSIVRNSEPASIFTQQYLNGDRQREIQRWRAMPTDIDLTIAVKTKNGKMTGVRVRDDDGITIKGATDTSSVYQLNEFVKVRREDATVETVSLVSNRDKAFVIPPQQETMIREYEPELIVSSTTYGGSGSVEVSGEGSAIPSVMLFSSTRETIKTLPAGDPDFTTTVVNYELAWDSITNGSDYTQFNATVSSWSGPRMSIYIDYRDPIWNYLLEKNTVQLRTTEFTRPLDGKVFARKVYTDFAIYPTDLVKYSPYQGRSELETFEEGKHSVRTMRVANNPIQSVAQENYVQSEKTADGKAPSLQEDNYAFGFAARPSVVGEASTLHGTETNFTTSKSPLAKVFF